MRDLRKQLDAEQAKADAAVGTPTTKEDLKQLAYLKGDVADQLKQQNSRLAAQLERRQARSRGLEEELTREMGLCKGCGDKCVV